ncbi:hypothetical protein BVY00_02040 [bacterium G20]|nr:hypothetical protein BVY00_02040 [bacterium G20]
MTIKKCDKCSKTISDKPVIISLGYWPKVELCESCAKPVLEFLDRKDLLQEELQKIGFKQAKAEV